MKTSIRGCIGSDGVVEATLITDMDSGQSKINVSIATDVTVETSKASAIEARWELISDLRFEFNRRLREILDAAV